MQLLLDTCFKAINQNREDKNKIYSLHDIEAGKKCGLMASILVV